MNTQTLYQQAIQFAATKHQEKGQLVPGTNLPYIVHLSNVAMEILMTAANTSNFKTGLALQVALLHDTIEDTATTKEELIRYFGTEVAEGVQAVTKNPLLPKDQQMADSLQRIQQQPKEVWAVKLADRITNLQPPPSHWDKAKKTAYLNEAKVIYDELQEGNEYLAKRLSDCIIAYSQFN